MNTEAHSKASRLALLVQPGIYRKLAARGLGPRRDSFLICESALKATPSLRRELRLRRAAIVSPGPARPPRALGRC